MEMTIHDEEPQQGGLIDSYFLIKLMTLCLLLIFVFNLIFK